MAGALKPLISYIIPHVSPSSTGSGLPTLVPWTDGDIRLVRLRSVMLRAFYQKQNILKRMQKGVTASALGVTQAKSKALSHSPPTQSRVPSLRVGRRIFVGNRNRLKRNKCE